MGSNREENNVKAMIVSKFCAPPVLAPLSKLPKKERFPLLLGEEENFIWKLRVFNPEEYLEQWQSKWEQPWS